MITRSRKFKVGGMLLAIAWIAWCGVAGAQEAQTVAQVKAKLVDAIDASDLASAQLKTFAKEKLIPLCTNAIFVKEVKAQNAKGTSLDEIKKNDEEWINAEDELPIHVEKLGNACAREITKVAASIPQIGETFVMDNQGANVGQNAMTSDYWQGDEAKFKNSFNGGQGGVDIGESKLDKSTGIVDQKVSLPIIDSDGKIVGAICIGVKTGQL
jgi:hypothetical protein